MNPASRLLAVLCAVLAPSLAAQTTPLRIEQTFEPQFPPALALSRITAGEARLIINIDATGRLTDWLIVGYTDRAFADEALQALKRWRYTPPTENGVPYGIRTELRFTFEARGRVVSLQAIDTPAALFEAAGFAPRLITHVCAPGELDRPITPLAPPAAFHPGKLAPTPQPQRVTIDFYVDETGRTRMPVVLDTPHELYAQAAVGAVAQWRFTAPTRAGKPVSVRVRQEFIFPASS
jgi:TonB family protein